MVVGVGGDLDAVVRHYQVVQREEERLAAGLAQLELLRTQEILHRHLPPPPAAILDVGGGTGVHAAWLAEEGYSVHIVDVTPRHVEKARVELGSRGVTAELGDARSLSAAEHSFDAALVLGPLYHLVERADRVAVLSEARRVVRPGGMVAVAAISRFASLFDGLAREFLFEPDFRDVVEQDLLTGLHRNPDERPHWFTTAFFHHPSQLRSEAEDAGLVVMELVGVEGLAGWLPHLAGRWATEQDRGTMLHAARVVESEPSLLGLSAHLMVLARAPG